MRLEELLEPHPAAELFPSAGSEGIFNLANDVRAHGLLEPIVTFKGKILDGRTRYAACLQADVEPRFVEWSGEDPIAFVVSRNLHRRHLDDKERALVAARAKWMFDAAARERQRAGVSAGRREGGKSSEKAAELLNVSARSVERASAVLESGDEQLIAAVEQGEVTLSRAAETVQGRDRADPVKRILRAITRLERADLVRFYAELPPRPDLDGGAS